MSAAAEAEDVDGEPGGGTLGQKAGDDHAAVAIGGDFFDFEAAALEVAAEVNDGFAEAAAAGEVEVGVVEGAGARGQGDAVDGRRRGGGQRRGQQQGDQSEGSRAQRGDDTGCQGRAATLASMTRLCLLAVVAFSACKDKKQAKEEEPKAAAEEVAEAADAAAKPAKAEPVMRNKMKSCPSAIAGVHTTIEKGEGTITAIVIGKDKPATETIRERARAVAAMDPVAVTEPKHTGKGEGGAIGKCPSRAPGAAVEVADIDGGAKLTFTPKSAADVPAIFEMLQARAKMLNKRGGRPPGAGGGGGQGGGHGGHGSTGRGGN